LGNRNTHAARGRGDFINSGPAGRALVGLVFHDSPLSEMARQKRRAVNPRDIKNGALSAAFFVLRPVSSRLNMGAGLRFADT
jgi:hypothetical protein